ncbi:MAG: MarR family transcriptional regulator [Defluviitaleaceae bacterium]|nr:MarR family transcriptional regulator [Defluviitaleaceae bacterium]
MSKEKVVQALEAAAEPLNTKGLVEATGLEKVEVEKAIKDLRKEGVVDSPKRYFYGLVK